MRTWLVAGVVLPAIMALTACGSESKDSGSTAATSKASFPVTVDDCGRKITFDRAPERVITGYQNTVELMIALGLQDRVVGRQKFDQAPLLPEQAAAFNKIPELAPGLNESDGSSPSREVELAARPDFYLGSGDFEVDASRGVASIKDFEDAGAQVYIMSSGHSGGGCDTKKRTIEQVYADIANLGKIFGIQKRADSLVADMKVQIADVQKTISGLPPVRMFAFDSGKGPLVAISNRYFDFQLAGADNVIKNQKDGYPEVSVESVAATNPEVLVTANYNPGPLKAEAEQKAKILRNALPNSPAVKKGRIVGIESIDLTPGVRNANAVREIAQALHPTAFK